jgi:plasmid stabilization system protein ParE
MQEIRARFQMLVDFPESGIRREEPRAGLRSFPVENYLIFYLSLTAALKSCGYSMEGGILRRFSR